MRRYRRFLLLVVLPLVALVAGLTFYLNGGRYVTTDDAYVGAQKVLITPDISGKIEKVVVKEGQQVKRRRRTVRDRSGAVPPRGGAGQAPRSTQAKTDLRQSRRQRQDLRPDARPRAAGHRAEAARRRAQIVAGQEQCRLAARSRQCVERAGHRAARSPSCVEQQLQRAKTQLLGNTDLPLEQFPPYAQAKAKLDDASAISTTPWCARRWPASPRRSSRSSSAASSPPARRYSRIIDVAEPLGRRQPEGIRFHLCRGRPDRHARGRRLPEPRVQGHGRLAVARHRRAIRDPAAAERHRQFRQGGAARAGADLFRQERQVSSAS